MSDARGDLRIVGRLFRQARPCWPLMLAVFAIDVLGAPIALLGPLPLKIAVDSVIGHQPLPGFLQAVLPAGTTGASGIAVTAVAILFIIATALLYLQSLAGWLLLVYTGERLVLDFRARLFGHVQRLSLRYHEVRGVSDSVYRIQYDATSIGALALDSVAPFVTAACMLGGMILVISRIDVTLAAIALGVCPVLVVLTEISRQRLRKRWPEVKELDNAAMGVVQETLGALRVVKAFGREAAAQERFMGTSRRRMWGELHVALIESGYDALIAIAVASATALVFFVGVYHIRAGVLSLGALLMVMAYLAELYEPLQTVGKRLGELQSSIASAERVFDVLDEDPEVPERSKALALHRANGRVEFRHVEFGYEPDRPVLHDISFSIQPGSRVGISGRTGSGKTTLISLLLRFYDPSSGAVLLDGVDLRDYRLADLRNQFAVVLQEPVLFSASIAENIAYARPGASRHDVEAAAKAANAHDFVTALPEGYETPVGERGMLLSGGERQRLSLARAFLRDAPILVLDEPTSSVDVATEAAIIDALERLMRDRTTFMIAHRLTTLESCDVTIELSNGRVASIERQLVRP